MGHDPDERTSGQLQRQLGMRRSVLVAAVVLFGSFAGLKAWEKLAVGDPVRLIRSGSTAEKGNAARELSVIDETTNVDRVMAALVGAVDDDDAEVRSLAEFSLFSVVSAVLRRPARTLADQKRTEQQVTVATRTFTKCLSDPAASIRELAAVQFGLLAQQTQLDAPPELIAALRDMTPAVQLAAVRALREFPLTASVVPPLIESLVSRDRTIRVATAELLGKLGPQAESAVPALLALLNEPFDMKTIERSRAIGLARDPACAAAKALGRISSNPKVIDVLTAMLSSDVDERTSSAAEGLGSIGPTAVAAMPSVIAAYDRMLRSKQRPIGQSAIAAAIGQIAPNSESAPQAVAILMRALDSKEWSVRDAAARALGNFGKGASAALPRLRGLEHDSEKNVRDTATTALAAIEAPPDAHAENGR